MQTKNGKIGYACLDLTIDDSFKTCRLKTFNDKGLSHIDQLALHNAKLLYKVIENNAKNNILMYRISSNLFPWFHLYDLEKLPSWQEIRILYYHIGRIIDHYKMRVSFHPDHFTVLGSENPKTVENSIKDLNHHSFILNLMNRPKNHFCKINIHVSNTKPDKKTAIKRFIDNFKKLDQDVQNRLTIENDDNKNGYTVQELNSVYEEIGTPIVFDTLHYNCNKGEQTYEEALNMACDTWNSVTPTAHHSSSKTIEQPDSVYSAHSDYLYEPFNYCGRVVDVMLEAKAKNLALKKYCEEFNIV